MNHLGVVLLLSLLPLHSDVVPLSTEGVISRVDEATEVNVLQDVTDDLRTRLQITEHVQITLVDHNPLVMSVETLAGRGGPFVISVDRDFIHELNSGESA